MAIFLTSDTHLNHPFAAKLRNMQLKEMDDMIIDNWNSQVQNSSGNHIYHLGDFAFGKNDEVRKIRSKLKGRITLILGNHDYKNNIQRLTDCFTDIRDLYTLNYMKQKIILCHYCMNTFESSHYDSYHCFGHSHNKYNPTGKRMDVGVDGHDFKLWTIEEIIEIMKNKPHNENYIEPENRYKPIINP